MDKKTGILNLIFAIIVFLCTGVNLLGHFIVIPEWITALSFVFTLIAIVLMIIVLIRVIQYRKNK